MLDTELLTLAHPAVQAVKQAFEKGKYKRKLRYSFDELFEFFKVDCVRINALVPDSGVSHQRLQQIYARYFLQLFANKTATERYEACTVENRLVRTKQSENELFEDPSLKRLVENARAAGCKVEAVPRMLHGKLSGIVQLSEIVVNGHPCSVHNLKGIWTLSEQSKRLYTRTSIKLSKLERVEAVIFFTQVKGFPEHVFVVPSAVLREAYFASSQTHKWILLPTEKLPSYKNKRHRIDWWKHEDAWHLLPPKHDPPAS